MADPDPLEAIGVLIEQGSNIGFGNPCSLRNFLDRKSVSLRRGQVKPAPMSLNETAIERITVKRPAGTGIRMSPMPNRRGASTVEVVRSCTSWMIDRACMYSTHDRTVGIG